jgi:flagellar biogenesis protein FliO
MSTYLINFIVYTTAMVGIIFLAVFVYKKCSCSVVSKSKFLNIEDCISLAPRKSLYVVRAGNERFLVAGDADKTTLISKLDENSKNMEVVKSSVDDLPSIVDFPKQNTSNKVFKNIINNL